MVFSGRLLWERKCSSLIIGEGFSMTYTQIILDLRIHLYENEAEYKGLVGFICNLWDSFSTPNLRFHQN